jgi:hypothetical protein
LNEPLVDDRTLTSRLAVGLHEHTPASDGDADRGEIARSDAERGDNRPIPLDLRAEDQRLERVGVRRQIFVGARELAGQLAADRVQLGPRLPRRDFG